ncbi:MAG: tripartite tricarboxylate transporter permease [Rhodospirillales bacterium]|nr:tripartite tricarboxylate transporter permease [Rhodospirillales bacterium]
MTEILSFPLGPLQILFTAGGVLMGIIIGVLPGLGPLLGMVLLTPFSMYMEPVAGLSLLIGVFVGGTFGGAVTAILLRIPGTPIAAATLLDGYPMTQQGRDAEALGIAVAASSIGGIVGGLYLILGAPLLAQFALRFAPPEYFALAFAGIVCIAVVSRGSTVKGLIVGCVGLLIATIGIDPFAFFYRFTFETQWLIGGIGIVPIVLGLFAVSEMMLQVQAGGLNRSAGVRSLRIPPTTIVQTLGSAVNVFRSSTIGTFIGALPGAGSVIAAFVSYAAAKGAARDPESFGKGNPDGVIATESANNACCGGTMIPSLALALPGDPCTAMLLAAILLLGFIPGPELFENSPELITGIFSSYMSANVFMLIFGFLLVPVFVWFVNIRKIFLVPVILVLCVVGSYGVTNSVQDLWFLPIFAVLALLLIKFDYPLAPLTIAPVLGPIMEENFRRSLIMSAGDHMIFLTRPLCTSILAISAVALVLAVLPRNPLKRFARKGSEL